MRLNRAAADVLQSLARSNELSIKVCPHLVPGPALLGSVLQTQQRSRKCSGHWYSSSSYSKFEGSAFPTAIHKVARARLVERPGVIRQGCWSEYPLVYTIHCL